MGFTFSFYVFRSFSLFPGSVPGIKGQEGEGREEEVGKEEGGGRDIRGEVGREGGRRRTPPHTALHLLRAANARTGHPHLAPVHLSKVRLSHPGGL